jgi:hypothetical protein
MTATATEQIRNLLHEAGETHHRVFRIVDGADDDWATWYADWQSGEPWETSYAQRILDHFTDSGS